MNAYDSHTDLELLSLSADGDEKAFTLLFKRYRNRLYHYILKHTRSAEISEEIVIDIFMRLWTDRDLISGIQDAGAFFHKIAFYRSMDYLRTVARHARLQKIYIDRLERADHLTPDALLISAEEKRLLLDAVNQLPPQRKLVYLMSRDENLSHSQIAEQLQISKSTVNNSIVSATRSITEYLKSHATGKAALSVFFFFYSFLKDI